MVKKIMAESETHRQPFGRVRQHLHLYLADYGSRQLQHVHAAGNAHRISVDQDLYHAVVLRRFGLRGEPSRVRGATSSSATDELQTASDALHIRLRLSMMKFRRVFDSIRYGVLVRAHACMSV